MPTARSATVTRAAALAGSTVSAGANDFAKATAVVDAAVTVAWSASGAWWADAERRRAASAELETVSPRVENQRRSLSTARWIRFVAAGTERWNWAAMSASSRF